MRMMSHVQAYVRRRTLASLKTKCQASAQHIFLCTPISSQRAFGSPSLLLLVPVKAESAPIRQAALLAVVCQLLALFASSKPQPFTFIDFILFFIECVIYV